MRRLLVLILTAGVAYAVVAAAGNPGISPTELAAGAGVVAPCDRDGIVVGYALRWAGHFAVERVVVGGIDDACVGLDLTAVLIVDGTSLEIGTATVTRGVSGDNPVSIDVATDVRVLDVETAHVVIA